MRILALFLLLALAAPMHAINYNVGVSPPVVDMGIVQRGSSNIVRFFVLTASPDPIAVKLEESAGALDFFEGNYVEMKHNFSEEPVDGWVEFFSNPIELLATGDIGYGIKGAREINFLLNVPNDAEPGYHLINIRPSPITQTGGEGQVGAQIAAITTINILFYVDGPATRSGNIADSTYRGGNIDTYFKNTGTVTIRGRAISKTEGIDAFSSFDLVRPGELHKFSGPFAAEKGTYNVETTVDYNTGSSSATSQVTLAESTVQTQTEQQAPEFPWWVLAVILIIAISILIYRRK